MTVLVHLPVTFNPDRRGRRRRIDRGKHMATAEEIAALFDAGGFLHEAGRGFWYDRGVVDRDDMMFLEVDLPDSPAMRRRLTGYARKVLLRRYRQKAIYLKFVGPVEALTITRRRVIS